MKPVFFFCPKCRDHHWLPDQLVELPDAAARFAKIEQLWEARDISGFDYEHWNHVIIAYACHQAISEVLDGPA